MERGRVIVVDDEVDILVMVRKVLVSEGLFVETFTEGDDALSRFAKQQTDAVVTDMRMPGMDGTELM